MIIQKEKIIGQKQGSWIIIKDLGIRFVGKGFHKKNGKFYPFYTRIVLVRCKCGRQKEMRIGHFNEGRSTQCKSCADKNNSGGLKHGMCYSREYKTWSMMIARCTNPNYNFYKNYGGRGIKVCDRWLSSFENFYKDMKTRPMGKTLDRVNNDGDYEPSNCRWATAKEQQNNRRR